MKLFNIKRSDGMYEVMKQNCVVLLQTITWKKYNIRFNS